MWAKIANGVDWHWVALGETAFPGIDALQFLGETLASKVPAMRSAPLFRDWPAVAKLMKATAKPAHTGFPQSIQRAMP